MGTLLISLLTLVLLVISSFIVLIILMQRTSQNGGMGAALGGGAAESAFGSETNNILTKGTIYGTIAFFMVSLILYLIYQAEASKQPAALDVKELISAGAPAESEVEVAPVLELEAADGTISETMGSLDAEVSEIQSEVEAATEAVTTESVPAVE
ncbi:MAG: preprotein translocase subunit SecG [Opitutaceae bacterium]